VFPDKDGQVHYEPTKQLDYELEMGFFVSKPVPYGQTLKISEIKEHIFGFVLLNDWSSRDIQWYERLPLGPFHGKGQLFPFLMWGLLGENRRDRGTPLLLEPLETLTDIYCRIRYLDITLDHHARCAGELPMCFDDGPCRANLEPLEAE